MVACLLQTRIRPWHSLEVLVTDRAMTHLASLDSSRLSVFRSRLVDKVVRSLSVVLGGASTLRWWPRWHAHLALRHTVGPTDEPALHCAHFMSLMPPIIDSQIGTHDFRCYDASRPHSSGHRFGPYIRSNDVDPIASQNNGPSANLVGLEATSNTPVPNLGVLWRTKPRAYVTV
ncbi:hypothetical protein ERO13_A07G133400v2 [Gossypium hirsutum]|nr:hypothetical protein ERO13_A07G133400v2 [Gossypium hirsutum]